MADNLKVDISSLELCTFNIRGLKNTSKANAIINSLKNSKINIIALQETHLIEQDYENYLNHIWQGPIVYAEGTSHSKGLCIMFDSYFKVNDISRIFYNDRILLCSFKVGDEIFFICNIYAPNDPRQKKQFFNSLKDIVKTHLNDYQLQNTIFLGDFNCVLNNRLDIISGEPHSNDLVKSFNSLLLDMELKDLWRINNPNKKDFTWSRKNPLIARRLDYIFANNVLIPFLTDCKILSMEHSDHRLVFCKLEFFKFRRGNGVYKLNSNLFDNNKFKESMGKMINNTIEDLKDSDPIIKWNVLKVKIREFAQQFGKYSKKSKDNQIINLREQLQTLENELVKDPNDENIQREIMTCKSKLEVHNLEKTEAARIRSKIKWIEEGEKCSKYFLGLEKNRAIASTIFKIKNQLNETIFKEQDIVEIFAQHFESIYDDESNIENDDISISLENFLKDVNLKQIKPEDKIILDSPISVEELQTAFKGLNKTSSPGLDGLTMNFYEIYFDELKHTLLNYYNFCFEQISLCENTQRGLISLIHKGKSLKRDEVGNWRPITLSNIDYKIIAKLLANRLKYVVDSIVGKQQQGFIKGRNIANIIRGIDDIMEYERNKNLNDILLIVDFKQAFDKISNSFITQVFKKFGFGDIFIQWIQTILNNRKSCVKNGGYLSRLFEVKCGVRQGCPIAPLLFVIAAEILAQNIIQDQSIQGITFQHANIKIKQFADDTSFFCRSIIDIREILSRLKSFSTFSGLSINLNKCSLLFMGKKTLKKN